MMSNFRGGGGGSKKIGLNIQGKNRIKGGGGVENDSKNRTSFMNDPLTQ